MIRFLAAFGAPNPSKLLADRRDLAAYRFNERVGEHSAQVDGSFRDVLRAGADQVAPDFRLQITPTPDFVEERHLEARGVRVVIVVRVGRRRDDKCCESVRDTRAIAGVGLKKRGRRRAQLRRARHIRKNRPRQLLKCGERTGRRLLGLLRQYILPLGSASMRATAENANQCQPSQLRGVGPIVRGFDGGAEAMEFAERFIGVASADKFRIMRNLWLKIGRLCYDRTCCFAKRLEF